MLTVVRVPGDGMWESGVGIGVGRDYSEPIEISQSQLQQKGRVWALSQGLSNYPLVLLGR